MKFNKEKTKKFASGGKSPKEIMEEARRNQALERQQQEATPSAIARDAANTAARDAVNNSRIATYQSTPVTIQAPRQEVVLKEYAASKPISFSQAFAEARKAGLKEFDWLDPKTGKTRKIAVKLEDDTIYDGGTLPEVVITGTKKNTNVNPPRSSSTTQENSSTRVVNQQPPLEKRVKDEIKNIGRDWSQEQAPNINYGTISAGSRSRRIDWGGLRRKLMGLNQGSLLYQQGGQLPAYNQGGVVGDFKNWVSSLVSPPNKHQVNSDTYTTYTRKDPFIGRSSETRSIVGPNGQTSTMVIRGIAEGNPAKIDTTFISPGYAKDPDLYPKFTPQDIREGNTKGRGNGSYLEKFTSPTYFPHIGKHQKGGKVEAPTDEMYVDFAVRYLSALGVGETEMVDEEGGLREEYAEAVTAALQEIDSPEFWEHYNSNPDEAVGAYVESKQSPEQVEMARKGAKLKKLQKLKKGTAKKCKCGCDLVMKKEKGGTITEVCSCGCKAK